MALLNIQQKMKEIGRIRLGDSTPAVSRNGTAYRKPNKLGTFKFTTRSASIAARVADVFGGTVVHEEHLGYGVITETSEIGVTIPPGDLFVDQAMELWLGGACERRCDTITCTIKVDGKKQPVPCMCPPDDEMRAELAKKGNACKPTTRLSVIVPDLPDVGVWRLETHGANAAGEIGATARILIAAREQDVYLPARLWLDFRTSKDAGSATREFYVPMLTMEATLRELSAASGTFAEALPAAPPDRKALAAGVSDSAPENRPENIPAGWATDDDTIDAELVDDVGAWEGTSNTTVPPVGASQTGGHRPPLVPATPAQEIADKAAGSRSKAMIGALVHRAADAGMADQPVIIAGLTVPLAAYLDARLKEVSGAG